MTALGLFFQSPDKIHLLLQQILSKVGTGIPIIDVHRSPFIEHLLPMQSQLPLQRSMLGSLTCHN